MNNSSFESAPVVTVLMSAYNTEKYIADTIKSILNQTFANFEFIIFNDGSTDSTGEIIESFDDKRIIFFDSKENYAYVKHLNRGIEIARGKYIARIDSDDIALPERIEKQVDFLEKNPEYGACGTFTNKLDQPDLPLYRELPSSDAEIKAYFIIGNPIMNPSSMIRTSILINNNLRYKSEVIPLEDAYMWYDISKISMLYNIPEALQLYRTHNQQITSTKAEKARLHAIDFALQHLRESGFYLNFAQERAFLMLRNLIPVSSKRDYKIIIETIRHLLEENNKHNIFQQNIFNKHILLLWREFIYNTSHYSPYLIPLLIKNNLDLYIPPIERIKIVIKCLLFWKK